MKENGQINIAILCNPLAAAGRSVQLAQRITLLLIEKTIRHSLFVNEWPAGFTAFTDVWIVGGDGTLNYFINHYPDIRLPLVVFKGGTGNDTHWLLYGNITLEEQLEKVLYLEPKQVDAGRCNGRLFINGVGIGFEGAVAKALTGKKKFPGKTSFLFTILKKIFSYRSQEYRVEAGNFIITARFLMIDAANGQRAGGGFHIAPESVIDDGWLDVVLVNPLHSFLRLLYLPVIEKGKHLQLSFTKHFRSKKIMVSSNKVFTYHLDGEYHHSANLEIEMIEGKLLFCY